MIKLQDFARERGVTDRAIQKHLKTYAAELEGLYERKGPNGTWLSEEACEILKSKMKQAPLVVGDSEQQRETERLKAENEKLKDALLDARDKIIELQDKQALLEAAEKETKLLEGFIADAKAEIKVLTDEKRDLSDKNSKLVQSVQDEIKTREDVEIKLKTANEEAWHHYRVALEIYNALPWWKKRRINAPVPPSETHSSDEYS